VYDGMITMITLSLPVVIAGAVVGALTDFLITGGVFSLDPLMPKLEKLNPVEGFKRLFSKKQVLELLKSTLKLGLAAYVAYSVLRGELRVVVATARATPGLILVAAGTILWRLGTRIAMLFGLLGIFDVWLQRQSFMKDMRMTKEEVKKEYKESEGDPHHKAARKQMHHEILEGAMMNEVANADVVITNPDHYAVALRYEGARGGAPVVVAKGADHLAQRIKALAQAAGVPTLEDVPLARALYRLEVEAEIPEALFDAVAEILSFVYAAQGMRAPRAPREQ
jgi:flagellar biosynthesis protein FlhB